MGLQKRTLMFSNSQSFIRWAEPSTQNSQQMAKACFGSAPILFPLRHLHLSPKPISVVHVTTTTTTTMTDARNPHPSLEIIGGARDLFLPAFNSLHRPYAAFPLIAHNRHLETIFASFFRSAPHVRYKRECLRTKDNGAVSLDWVSGDHRRLPPYSPVLILLVRALLLE